MNILILTANPISTPGGVERFCHDIVEMCNDKQWNVRVLTPHDLLGRTVSLNAVIEPILTYRLSQVAAQSLDNIDLVISNGIWGSWIDQSIPRVNVYHGTWVGNYIMGQPRSLKRWIGRQIRTRLERRSGRNAINVAVSEAVKNEVEQYYGLTVTRVIENGVDLQLFSPPTEKEKQENKARLGLDPHSIMAIYAGRMEWRKGIDHVTHLARTFKSFGQSSTIQFCVLTPKVEDNYYCDNIRYIIGNNIDHILQTFKAADVFIFPSRYEGCEYVTLEALATGLPVIGRSTGAMQMIKQRDHILGKYIADDCQTEVIQENLENYLVLSEKEKTDLSRRARLYAEEWASLDLFRRNWISLIEGINNHEQC